MTTDTSRCLSCRHCERRPDPQHGRVDMWCVSPQLAAATGRASRCIFEADGFEKEWNRDRLETRKCGVTFQNWEGIAQHVDAMQLGKSAGFDPPADTGRTFDQFEIWTSDQKKTP